MSRVRGIIAAVSVAALAGVGLAGAGAGPAAADDSVFTVYLSPSGSDSVDGLSPAAALYSLARA
jgi:hypothetical protein